MESPIRSLKGVWQRTRQRAAVESSAVQAENRMKLERHAENMLVGLYTSTEAVSLGAAKRTRETIREHGTLSLSALQAARAAGELGMENLTAANDRILKSAETALLRDFKNQDLAKAIKLRALQSAVDYWSEKESAPDASYDELKLARERTSLLRARIAGLTSEESSEDR